MIEETSETNAEHLQTSAMIGRVSGLTSDCHLGNKESANKRGGIEAA